LIQRFPRRFNSSKVTNFIYFLVAGGSMNWGLESHFVTNFFILLQQGSLADVQPLHLRRVEQSTEQRQWRELIDRYHYLGYRTAYGASVRYLIETPHRQPAGRIFPG
jgi:hypothetical protein